MALKSENLIRSYKLNKIITFLIVFFLIIITLSVFYVSNQINKTQTIFTKPKAAELSAGTINTLWSAGMENGNLDEWWSPGTQANPGNNHLGGEFDSGIGDSVASQDYAHRGAWSAKMTITTPSGTSETSGTRLFRWGEPETYPALYYSVWYYFPQRYSVPNWWNVLQWKSKRSDTINDPFFILNIGNRADGSMYYYLYDWQRGTSYDQTLMNIPEGKWTQVEAFYQCAGDNTGHVTIWQDGKPIFDVSNVQTRYSDGVCQWSVNNYSNLLTPSPATIYTDDASIATSKIGAVIPQAPILISITPTTTLPSPTAIPPPTSTPTPPVFSVTITSPYDGTTIYRKSSVRINASIANEVNVSKVEFYVNNSLRCMVIGDTPYICYFNTSGKPNATYNLQVKAYNKTSQSTLSNIVKITTH